MTTARKPRRHLSTGLLLTLLAVSGAFGLALWRWGRERHDQALAHVVNGRILFWDTSPGYSPPPHGGFGAFPDEDLYAMQPEGTGLVRLTSATASDWSPTLSPDRSRIAFVRGGEGPSNVLVSSSAGRSPRQITFCRYSGCIQSVAWSPDASWLAYLRGWDLYLIRPDGTDNHLISRCGDCTYEGLTWSPDGDRIAIGTTGFPGSRYGGVVVLTLGNPADRGLRRPHPITFCAQPKRFCHRRMIDSDPAWAPDGEWIAFAHDRSIWVVRPNGHDEHALIPCRGSLAHHGICVARAPVWSPDGTKIAFAANGIYTANADGTGLVRIRSSGIPGSWETKPVTT